MPGKSNTYIATIAHTDIVPLGLGWTFPALDVTRKDGYLIGRGVLDDKGPFVLSLYAATSSAVRLRRRARSSRTPSAASLATTEETGMG